MTRSVHAWYLGMHEDSKAPTAEVDEEGAVFYGSSLVEDLRVNLEFNRGAGEEGGARPRAFERGDVDEVIYWIRVPSVICGIMFIRLRVEF